MTDNQNWLAEYAQTGSDAAFRELVTRYVDLVYSTALRLVGGDAHRAKDVAQTVFINLARVARTLPKDVKLGGWLHRDTCFTASTLMRGERRRQVREKEAAEMNALQNTTEVDYSLVAPVLDEAINELGEADRTAILLRFFEQQDFRSVGQALSSNEDAARMRVTRALEKLEAFLKRRGITTTATSLGVVLSANAVQAAPVGLALTLSTAAAITGTTLATTATITATKAIAMTAFQKTIVTATITVLAGVGLYEARQASQLREQVQILQQQQAAAEEQIQQLQSERDDAANRVALLTEELPKNNINSSELLKLRGEVGRLRREDAEAKTPITRDQVESRYKNAQELARNGNPAAALNEFLWCFDEGMPRVTGYGGVRTSYLLSSIAKLGEEYPAALTALRERRDNASQRMLDSKNDSDAAHDFAAINRTLKEDQNTLAVFDQLPSEDPRRQTLANAAYRQLVEAQRYGDALLGKPYASISAQFELRKAERPLPANIANAEMIRKSQRNSLINSTAMNVEVLAGAGDLEHARTLAARLLAYDNSPETKALLQQHANRAGQAGLLEGLPTP